VHKVDVYNLSDPVAPMARRFPHLLYDFLTHVITLILLIVAFVFSVLGLSSNAWAYETLYLGADQTVPSGQNTRGPFSLCQLNSTTNLPSGPIQQCYRIQCVVGPDGSFPTPDDKFFCQQLHVWGGLLIAANVLTGLAMFGMFLQLVLTLRAGSRSSTHAHHDNTSSDPSPSTTTTTTARPPQSRSSSVFPTLTRTTNLTFLLVASITSVLGTTQTLNLLVNNQGPDADYLGTVVTTTFGQYPYSHWMWSGTGAVYAALGCIFVVVPLALAPWWFWSWHERGGVAVREK